MQTYEYLEVTSLLKDRGGVLTELGKQGWKLQSSFQAGQGINDTFMRPVDSGLLKL